MPPKTQTKNVYWCADNIYSGWTSLYFRPDPSMHIRIKYVGVGNWQYTGDGTWFVVSRFREKVLTDFVKSGYRTKEITAQEAEGRQRVHNARKGSENTRTQYNRQEEERKERNRREKEANRRSRETYDAFNEFFGGEYNRRAGSVKSFKEVEDAWLILFYAMDKEVAHRLYRQAAVILHPDNKGDEEVMKALNTAWHTFENPNSRRR